MGNPFQIQEGDKPVFNKPYLMVMVDDQEDLSDILSEYLEDMCPGAFTIQSFLDPENALEFIEKNPVRIVVTDVRMPRMNGDKVNLRVKQMGRVGSKL